MSFRSLQLILLWIILDALIPYSQKIDINEIPSMNRIQILSFRVLPFYQTLGKASGGYSHYS